MFVTATPVGVDVWVGVAVLVGTTGVAVGVEVNVEVGVLDGVFVGELVGVLEGVFVGVLVGGPHGQDFRPVNRSKGQSPRSVEGPGFDVWMGPKSNVQGPTSVKGRRSQEGSEDRVQDNLE